MAHIAESIPSLATAAGFRLRGGWWARVGAMAAAVADARTREGGVRLADALAACDTRVEGAGTGREGGKAVDPEYAALRKS
jgi:hypothetical protein